MTPSHRVRVLLPLAIAVGLMVPGCKDVPSVTAVQWEIERQFPGIRLEREHHIHIGRFKMAIARKIVRWAGVDDDEDLAILQHVRRVNVATYRVLSPPDSERPAKADRLQEKLTRNGWELVVRQRDGGEQTWVFTRQDGAGSLSNIYVVSLDRHELTVVDVEGRIGEILATALADDPEEFAEIFGA